MKLLLARYHRFAIVFSVICTLVLINPLQIIAVEAPVPQNSQVEATISDGAINVVIKEDHIADIITVSAMPYIAESFVGYTDVVPGLKKEGVLELINETGETYKVIDYHFTAEMTRLKRIYNDAAVKHLGPSNLTNHETAIALSGDEWYQMNAEHFGEENFNDMDVLRKMFGWGDATQGVALSGYETGQKMIDLGFRYLYQNCIQFSFNTDTAPVDHYDTKNIHMLDYINKTDANKAFMLNQFFADEIGNEGLFMKIGYSMDNARIGNAYNSANADFGFELILERIVDEETETVEPEKPESEPDNSNPDMVEPPNSSSNAPPSNAPSSKSSLIRDDRQDNVSFASDISEMNPDIEKPAYKNPKAGMPDNMLRISLLFVLCGMAALIHKKRQ